MKVYQILSQVFYTDGQDIERSCGMCFEEGFTFSSKAKAEREITEILKENNLSWANVNLFPKLSFEKRDYPEYNGSKLVRKVWWLNEIEVL